MSMPKGYKYAQHKVRTVILTTEEEKDQLLKLAQKNKKSINKMINAIIEEYLKNNE